MTDNFSPTKRALLPLKPMQDQLSAKEVKSASAIQGANIAWKELYQEYYGKKVPLPTYPFPRKIYWLDGDC